MVTSVENLADPLKIQRVKKLLMAEHYHRNIQWSAIFASFLVHRKEFHLFGDPGKHHTLLSGTFSSIATKQAFQTLG
ncbi:hypothetical protein [Cyclobacterium plantarum]|uniref:Uncharacterized protein n=1 Tax=Cyclobacterium plantarum TaxID=2716263 RepID=A0ABX0H4T4_9BACT|nr:hypothetical protein [Cyclobacterium plantarum]NHE56517.1 hypothetical protein [Cyclobacterium plantarum]